MEIHNKQLVFLKRKLDRDIGYHYWKKYVASAFWAQISTPVNLIITFLTAITTAQAQTQDLIPTNLYSQIAIVSLVITTLNTFFRPHTQYATNTEYMSKWNDIGVRFEKEYYDKVTTHLCNEEEFKSIESKIKAYQDLQDEVNALRKSEGTGTINFVTDLIFLIVYRTCLRKYKRWLDLDTSVKEETDTKWEQLKKDTDRKMLAEEQHRSEIRIALERIHIEEESRLSALRPRETSLNTIEEGHEQRSNSSSSPGDHSETEHV